MKKHAYKHIIWDWNGTLFDDAWLCLEIVNQLLQRRNLPTISAENYQAIFGFPVIDYYQKAGFDFTHEPFEVISTAFIQGYEAKRKQCQLRTDSIAVLKWMDCNGFSQSILSASQQSSLDQIVAQFDLASYFVKVLGIDNHHAFGKLKLGQQWVSELGLQPAEVLLVGDTTHDYEVAQAMGVDCWLIPSGHQSPTRLAQCGAPVVDSLQTLLTWFANLKS